MIIPVRCFTCGKVLADKYQHYQEAVRAKKMQLGIDDTFQNSKPEKGSVSLDAVKQDGDSDKEKVIKTTETTLGITGANLRNNISIPQNTNSTTTPSPSQQKEIYSTFGWMSN